MLIIIDKKIPEKAKKKLREYGDVLEFETEGIVYKSISGHPDIFFCNINDSIVFAPNTPSYFVQKIDLYGIRIIKGELPLENKYPETARYNAVYSNKNLFHNFRYTDSVITDMAGEADLIHINQGYARCNLLPLDNECFLTSDQGIKRTIERYDKKVIYVNPEKIFLEGQKHGFIGGCCGIADNKLFLLGSLDCIRNNHEVSRFIEMSGLELVELYKGSLIDGGSILFLDKP